MLAKSTASPNCYLSCNVFVIAAVNVVLPWSTCPIVPILTCGLFLSNLALAILKYLPIYILGKTSYTRLTHFNLY